MLEQIHPELGHFELRPAELQSCSLQREEVLHARFTLLDTCCSESCRELQPEYGTHCSVMHWPVMT